MRFAGHELPKVSDVMHPSVWAPGKVLVQLPLEGTERALEAPETRETGNLQRHVVRLEGQ